MKTPGPSDTILFLHLQKTAGMTLQELLRRQYGIGFTRRIINRLTGKSPEGLTLRDALSLLSPRDKIFMGHFCFGIHRMLDFNTTYITFLRDPAARLVSLYNYSKRTPSAHYYKVAKDMSCEEFLLESKLLEMDNGMTRFIAGDDEDLFINRTPYGSCDRKILDKALSNLDKYFSFIGIQEEFDKSILLLSKIFNWSNPYYVSLNRGKGNGRDLSSDDNLKERIIEKNPLDVELYNECRNRFQKAYNTCFQNGDEALEDFRKGNIGFQRWAYPLYKARSSSTQLVKKLLKVAGV